MADGGPKIHLIFTGDLSLFFGLLYLLTDKTKLAMGRINLAGKVPTDDKKPNMFD